MAEKSLVNEDALIDGGGAAELELVLGLLVDVPLLPHAAARRAAPVATEVRASFLLRRFNETTFARELACMSTRRELLAAAQTQRPLAR
jgi:hypothetical protein